MWMLQYNECQKYGVIFPEHSIELKQFEMPTIWHFDTSLDKVF